MEENGRKKNPLQKLVCHTSIFGGLNEICYEVIFLNKLDGKAGGHQCIYQTLIIFNNPALLIRLFYDKLLANHSWPELNLLLRYVA